MKGDLYMHTFNGEPAEYVPEERRICVGMRKIKRLASSMAQIHRERRHSIKFYGDQSPHRYSHIRIARAAEGKS